MSQQPLHLPSTTIKKINPLQITNIILTIISFTPVNDLRFRISQTNKLFNKCSKNKPLWKNHCSTLWKGKFIVCHKALYLYNNMPYDSYYLSIIDNERNVITFDELTSIKWVFHFKYPSDIHDIIYTNFNKDHTVTHNPKILGVGFKWKFTDWGSYDIKNGKENNYGILNIKYDEEILRLNILRKRLKIESLSDVDENDDGKIIKKRKKFNFKELILKKQNSNNNINNNENDENISENKINIKDKMIKMKDYIKNKINLFKKKTNNNNINNNINNNDNNNDGFLSQKKKKFVEVWSLKRDKFVNINSQGRWIQINQYPPLCVTRNPINWGFILENRWVSFTSY